MRFLRRRPVGPVWTPDAELIRELTALRAALIDRGPADRSVPPSWPTVVELAEANEAEMAIDNLCRHIAHAGYALTPAEFDTLARMATRCDSLDAVTEHRLADHVSPSA